MLVAAWLTLSALFLLSRATTQDAFSEPAFAATARPLAPTAQATLTRQLRHRYGLDQPLFYVSWQDGAGWRWHNSQNQYHAWLTRLGHGDLGRSYREDAPVRTLLGRALRYTLPLTLLATAGSLGLAVWLAIGLSYRPGWRRGVVALLHGVQSLPLFLVAVSLLLLLANPDVLAWFPAFGLGPDEADSAGWAGLNVLYHLALPVLSLVIVSLPVLVIHLDGAIRRELHQPYVATARAKGLARRQVVRRHVLRNALLPTVALLTDLLPNLVAGSVVVEVLFALPGMGRLLAEAAAAQDYPVLLGAVGLVALVRLLAQWLTDLGYQLLDPRIRL